MRNKRNLISEIKRLFNPLEIVIYLVLFFSISYYALELITGSVMYGLVAGTIGAIYFFFVIIYQNYKTNNYQENLNDLLKYTNNMIFYMQSGENVYYALQITKSGVNKEVQGYIEKTLTIMDSEARFDASHFKDFDFPTLELFHENLSVFYDRGGDVKELFSSIQKEMVDELDSRDTLYRKRKGQRANILAMLLLVGVMPIMLKSLTPSLWDIFLSYKMPSFSVIGITYFLLLLNLYFAQKKTIDISVRV